ncbi:AraC family transcriptional regulator [Anaeromicropila herbilytica]|uniref:AraC family transcriptional regulator n=1 Tax=Anaeromicropila herbilytica TaxID=2785025 RepID=A0A7R7EJS2_9FIRM|nr:AraC family transcriptional regulator [Anaeromicropila herbilytica]BCN30072.1 AraC family transcriptional regulator [Anaeromicropila herbilytica]
MDSTVFPAITEYDCKLPYYITGIGSGCMKVPYKKEGFPLFQWIQARSGEGIVHVDGKDFKMTENTGILIFPNESYELQINSNFWCIDWIVFGGYGVEEFFQRLDITETAVYKLVNYNTLYYKFERLLKMSKQMHPYKRLDISCSVYDFITSIVKNCTANNMNIKSSPKVEKVYEYIEEHYNDIIMLEDLSDIIGTSPQYFCKLFKEVTGYRVVEYINCLRIRKSKELMFHYNDMKITDIAASCGFEDSSYFCSVFRKLEGITPGEFRKKYFDK